MASTWTFRIAVGLLLAFLLYWLVPNETNPRPELWNMNIEAKTLTILGLKLQESQLNDAIYTLKSTPDIAMFTKRQRPGSPEPAMHLEAYFEDLFNEGDSMIVTLQADEHLLQLIKKQAYQPKLFPNDTIRVSIKEEWANTILELPIRSITMIAGERLDIAIFEAKFGKPSQLIDDGQGNAHVLYPTLGLDFIQPADGHQVLQFVSPAAFDVELLEPLVQAQPSRQP